MATEVKNTRETATPKVQRGAAEQAEIFWLKNSKTILYAFVGLVVVVGGYFGYRNFVVVPKEKKASEAMWKAEDYYRMDSARLALNGDGSSLGFLKIISRYGGTKAGNLAKFYAGSCYMKIGDFANAIKYLKDFSTDDKLISVRIAGLLGDAYSESGKKAEAAAQYKTAGTMFPDDNYNSPEYLFRAGLLYQELGKNDDAVAMFKTIKEKYPDTQHGRDVEKYLARLGYIK